MFNLFIKDFYSSRCIILTFCVLFSQSVPKGLWKVTRVTQMKRIVGNRHRVLEFPLLLITFQTYHRMNMKNLETGQSLDLWRRYSVFKPEYFIKRWSVNCYVYLCSECKLHLFYRNMFVLVFLKSITLLRLRMF